MPHFVITANDLRDGSVRWLTDDNGRAGWTAEARAASVAADAAGRDAWLALAEADVAANSVVGVYAVEVAATGDGFVHTSVRERVRAGGPTIGPATT
ncbi:MAG: DUF2849 domain-containing protein [Alphaproteobacteria bacterium]